MNEDIVGQKTLQTLEKADRYLELSSKEIGRHLQGKVLELGSGTGNLTTYLTFSHEITALDINPQYLKQLADKIKKREESTGLRSKPFQTAQADFTEPPQINLVDKYETLLSCQVLEHLQDDVLVLKNYLTCLKKGGKVVLQLPAMPTAFSDLDKNLGHYRRYTRESAEALLKAAGLEVVESYYFNFIGLLGWFWAGRILKKQILPSKELSVFNFFAGFLLKFDIFFSRLLGLNVIAIGKKPL